jgi:hypothetical protein
VQNLCVRRGNPRRRPCRYHPRRGDTACDGFTGRPRDAAAFLAEIAADNTREFRGANRHRRVVDAPSRALAAELEPESGPVRVLRAHRDRRFRSDAPPYRTDTGVVAAGPGGVELSGAPSATAFTTAVGRRRFRPRPAAPLPGRRARGGG